MWETNGTLNGTVPVTLPAGISTVEDPQFQLAAVGGELYFTYYSQIQSGPTQLLVTDGTTTTLLSLSTPAAAATAHYRDAVTNLTNVNGALFFDANRTSPRQ